MQGQAQQQAYDRGITIFSPDGRLYQVEYAREAVKRGSASIGIRTPEGVVVAADKRSRSPLMEPTSVEKIHKADDHIGVASAGHVADARRLIDFARRSAQINRLRYGEPIGIETLTKQITDHIQQYTQVGGARPFGVALLIAGVENGNPSLYETDPSGTPYEWKAVSIGADRNNLQEFLEERYEGRSRPPARTGWMPPAWMWGSSPPRPRRTASCRTTRSMSIWQRTTSTVTAPTTATTSEPSVAVRSQIHQPLRERVALGVDLLLADER
jgi:proteasome alpha subunit